MKNTLKKEQDKKKIYWMIPVLTALCLIPLIVLTKDYSTDFTQFDWFNNTVFDQIDSFEYSKGVMVIVLGLIGAFMIAVSQYIAYTKKQPITILQDKKITILWGVEIVFILISSIFSKYSDLAFHGGGYGQWQTMWVLLGYCMLFMNAYLFVDSERCVLVLIKCMMVSTAWMAILGTLQSCGNNPLTWDFAQKMITSNSSSNGISFKDGISNVVMTFSNPNYVGMYVALVLPIVVAFVIAKMSENKSVAISLRILGALVGVGLIKTLFGAGSSAGAIAVLASIPISLIFIVSGFFAKKEKEEVTDEKKTAVTKKNIIIVSAIVVVIIGGCIGASKTTFVEKTANKILQGGTDTRNILCISNQEDKLKVELRNGDIFYLIPSLDNTQRLIMVAIDEKKQEIPVSWDNTKNAYVLQSPKYQMITLKPSSFTSNNIIYKGFEFADVPNKITWTFMQVDGKWKLYTPFGKFISLREIEHFGFKNTENIANRRGYIWSRTIPLMKQYWFKGIGPNAFIIAFPNDDFVGSKRVGGSTTLVDKPHNTFLQLYTQIGGIYAIAYVGLWLLYVIGAVKIFWRRKCKDAVEVIGLGLFVGLVCHAIAGLTNDSIIGVQNIYWILLGTGYAVNRIIRAKDEAKIQEAIMQQKKLEQQELRKTQKKSRGRR